MDLPIELYEIIHDFLPFIGQIHLRQVSKHLYTNLRIYDFSNIKSRARKRITNEILMNYPLIETLNLYKNNNVTNLDFLTNLEKLDLTDCFTVTNLNKLTNLQSLKMRICGKLKNTFVLPLNNESFKHCTNLTKLNINGYKGITDLNHLTKLKTLKCCGPRSEIGNDSIKHLDLYELHASGNMYISDVNHMTNLRKLWASNPFSIFPESGIKQLNLQFLGVCDNPRINDINHMTNLTYLNAAYNSGIDDNGIKNLSHLKTLICDGNRKITPR
jgi:hypothetical protein